MLIYGRELTKREQDEWERYFDERKKFKENDLMARKKKQAKTLEDIQFRVNEEIYWLRQGGYTSEEANKTVEEFIAIIESLLSKVNRSK